MEKIKLPEGKQRVKLFVIIAVVAFIWFHSLMSRETSSNESEWVKELIFDPLCELIGRRPFSMHTIRKLAHFTEYAVLGFLLTWYRSDAYISTVFCGFTIAFIDETIQLLGDRGPSIQDVWIDIIGTCAGMMVYLFIAGILRNMIKWAKK